MHILFGRVKSKISLYCFGYLFEKMYIYMSKLCEAVMHIVNSVNVCCCFLFLANLSVIIL